MYFVDCIKKTLLLLAIATARPKRHSPAHGHHHHHTDYIIEECYDPNAYNPYGTTYGTGTYYTTPHHHHHHGFFN